MTEMEGPPFTAQEVDEAIQQKAIRTVRKASTDEDDARMLLDMLGLL